MASQTSNLTVKVKTAAQRKAFMEEFARSSALHGESYDINEKESGEFHLRLKSNAPMDAGLPLVYMNVQDWVTLWKEPQDQISERRSSGVAYGVYKDPQSGELWIDGSWRNAYGNYQKDERNVRVEKAQREFPTAKIHADPGNVGGWNLVG